MLFPLLKLLHVSCALLSISGFALRGYWMYVDNPLLRHRATRILPHLVDTLLLGSAIGMLLIWRLNPLDADWLIAKILALLVYIGLGMVALRFGSTRRLRVAAFAAALLTAAYIVAVAVTRAPLVLSGT